MYFLEHIHTFGIVQVNQYYGSERMRKLYLILETGLASSIGNRKRYNNRFISSLCFYFIFYTKSFLSDLYLAADRYTKGNLVNYLLVLSAVELQFSQRYN